MSMVTGLKPGASDRPLTTGGQKKEEGSKDRRKEGKKEGRKERRKKVRKGGIG
jgi:hypothetical protein